MAEARVEHALAAERRGAGASRGVAELGRLAAGVRDGMACGMEEGASCATGCVWARARAAPACWEMRTWKAWVVGRWVER